MGGFMMGFGVATFMFAALSHLVPGDPGPAPTLAFVSAICLALVGAMIATAR